MPSGAELLAQLRAGEMSAEVVIYLANGEFLFCLDSEMSRAHVLTREEVTAPDFLLETGRRKVDLRWVRVDEFPREVVWEGRAPGMKS